MPTREEVVEAVQRCGSKRGAARELGVDPNTIKWHLGMAERWGARETLQDLNPIPEGIPVESLIDRRIGDYSARAAIVKAQSFRRIGVKIDGPIGILHMGDPHVDDDGTDIELLFRHTELTRKTEGLYAANIGDMTNNWIGRLVRLYAEQGTSAKQGREIAEYFLKSADWLYLVGGNHDYWTGGTGVLDWYAKQAGLYQSGQFHYHGVRMGLEFYNGFQCRINSRHDFRGTSEMNNVYGGQKEAKMAFHDHIMVCGHRHISGYGTVSNPAPETGDGEVGIISHCIRVGSYKKIDSFAREKGLPYQNFSPAIMTIINPSAVRESAKIHVALDPEDGAEYLTWLRNRK